MSYPTQDAAHAEQQQQQQPEHLHPQQQQALQGQYAPYQQYSSNFGTAYQPYYAAVPQQQQGAIPVNDASAAGAIPAPGMTPYAQEAKGWVMTKCALHAICVLCCIIAIGVTLGVMNKGTMGYFFLLMLPVPGISLVWSSAELITRAVKKFTHGIHPGAHVALCLLIWIAASITAGGISVSAALSYSAYNHDYSESSFYCDFEWNSETSEYEYYNCMPPYAADPSLYVALAIFSWGIFLTNFVLFIGACVDTARRNASKRGVVMVVNQPTGYWGQGWQPVPDGNAGQHGQSLMVPQPQQQQQYAPANDIPMQPVNEKGESTQGQQGMTEFYAPESSRR